MRPPGVLQRAVLPELFALNWRFQETVKSGPDPTTRDLFREFWRRPDLAALRSKPELPRDDWESFVTCLQRVTDGEAERDSGLRSWDDDDETLARQPWRTVALLSEDLAADDPMAASMAAACATAAWEGALGTALYEQPWVGHHWGWHVFPLALGRTLLAADAVWTARSVADLAMGFIEAAKNSPFDERLTAILDEYSELAAGVERRLTTCTANLAWDLWASLEPAEPNFRAEVAAMLWTLGDVPHAERLARDDEYKPPLGVVRDLVQRSMDRLSRDSFVQYLWLELKDRPPFDLRGHKVLFSAINNVFSETPAHELNVMGPYSPSPTYARTAIEYFRGSVSAEQQEEFRLAFDYFNQLVGLGEPDTLLRFAALYNLALTEDEQTRSERWLELADLATQIVTRAIRRGVFEPLNNRLDAPFYYLSEAPPGDALDALERYRCGALAYWLAITPPPAPAEDALASLLEEEGRLLRELRGARFIRLLPHLPRHYGRYGFRLDEAFDEPIPEGATELHERSSLLRFDPFDQSLAERELDDAWDRLDELWERMEDVDPAYAAERTEPFASHEEFQRALSPPD